MKIRTVLAARVLTMLIYCFVKTTHLGVACLQAVLPLAASYCQLVCGIPTLQKQLYALETVWHNIGMSGYPMTGPRFKSTSCQTKCQGFCSFHIALVQSVG